MIDVYVLYCGVQPENLLRRLSATKFFGIDVRGDGYIDDGARQLELYQEAKAYLRSFDVVSTTEQFSSTWNYICHFADLNSIEVDFENEPNKAKSILKKGTSNPNRFFAPLFS